MLKTPGVRTTFGRSDVVSRGRRNSVRRSSKMEIWVPSWRPRTNAFCDFSSSYCACHEKWCQVIRSAAPVRQNHLSKPEDLMLQNATPLRKSAPGPPNSSDEHVSCTAPATENASLQILFTCPTPAIVFGNATKPLRFAHFWQGPLATSKNEEVLQNCFVFDVIKFKNWGGLAELLRFWCCQVQKLRKSRGIASFSSLQIDR